MSLRRARLVSEQWLPRLMLMLKVEDRPTVWETETKAAGR